MFKFFRTITIIITAAILIASVACASSSSKTPVAPEMHGPLSAPPAPSDATASAPATWSSVANREDARGYAGDSAVDESIDRKIVRTGSMTIEVDDISKSLADIAEIAAQYDGYVVSSSQRANTDKDPSGHISIRVPADRYEDVLAKLREIAVKVIYENSNSQDVTEQYTDLQAQLNNYQATEAQFLELLKKAEDVKDILEVQKELSNVRGNIERVKGRMLYLERTSDTSLIQVSLTKARPIGESTWDVTGIFKVAVDGLIGFGKVLLALVIWLLVFSPVWILILVIIWLVRRKKAKAAVQK